MIPKPPSKAQIIQYVYEQFRLVYSCSDLSVQELGALCLEAEGINDKLNEIQKWEVHKSFSYKGYEVPVFFEENIGNGLIVDGVVQFDLFLNVFILLSGLQEWLVEDRDSHGRFRFKDSIQSTYGFVKTPVVNIYFELLVKALLINDYKCVPKNTSQGLVFTHDIDQVRSGWLSDFNLFIKGLNKKGVSGKGFSLLVNSLFTKVLGLKDRHYLALLNMLRIDKQYNSKAISFVMSKKSHDDADYGLRTSFKDIFKGHPIGFHPGYYTHDNQAEFEQQKETLEQIFVLNELKVRQHFLRYDIRQTTAIHDSVGVKEDFSLGFVEQEGFRNSYAGQFHLFRFDINQASKVLQVPLYFMDGTLITYKQDASKEAKEAVYQEIERLLQNFSCNFSVLFHNTVFDEQTHLDFIELYEALLRLQSRITK